MRVKGPIMTDMISLATERSYREVTLKGIFGRAIRSLINPLIFLDILFFKQAYVDALHADGYVFAGLMSRHELYQRFRRS